VPPGEIASASSLTSYFPACYSHRRERCPSQPSCKWINLDSARWPQPTTSKPLNKCDWTKSKKMVKLARWWWQQNASSSAQ